MFFENNTINDFEIQLLNNDIQVVSTVNNFGVEGATDSKIRWLEFVLKPKLLKWCHNSEINYDLNNVGEEKQSIRLIDNEKYNRLYNEFKDKYSECAMRVGEYNFLTFLFINQCILFYMILEF